MAETLCNGFLDRETEFVVAFDPATNTTVRRFGTCGQQAAHAVISCVLNRYVGTAELYTAMRRRGICDPSGASTASGLQTIIQAYGVPVVGFRQWTDSNWGDWQAAFDAHAGVDPFLFETHEGYVLVDLITGAHENANIDPNSDQRLQNHYVAVLGKHSGGYSARAGRDLPAGYWCADGASFAGNNDNAHSFNAAHMLQFYSVASVAASLPRAMVAAKGKASMGVPNGWKDDGKTLTAPNGKQVIQGFRYAVLNAVPQWPSDNVPLEGVRYVSHIMTQDASKGAGSVQTFYRTRLYWLQATNTVGEVPLGAEVLALEAQIAKLQAQLAQAQQGTADPLAVKALLALRTLKAVEAEA